MTLTSQAQAFLDALAEQNPPPWEQLTPEEGRAAFAGLRDLFGEGPAITRVENRWFPGDLSVRVYSHFDDSALEGERQPAVMYFHGGGWVLGNLDTHDALCRRLARSSGCTILSVDYSLSPEARFPKAVEQCYAATAYVAEHAETFNICPDRLAVAGDSAGGNLAAAVAIKARDEAGPEIKLQVLVYPVIEPAFNRDSYQQFGENYGLTRSSMQWFWQQYLGPQQPAPLAVPSQAESLRGLPTAHVITAEYDVLRDEGEAYARRLADEGVPTTMRRYDGNLHGFIHFAGVFDDGLRAAGDIATVLRKHLRAE
jgi:acetyl esterase